jgi:hypothetical protein
VELVNINNFISFSAEFVDFVKGVQIESCPVRRGRAPNNIIVVGDCFDDRIRLAADDMHMIIDRYIQKVLGPSLKGKAKDQAHGSQKTLHIYADLFLHCTLLESFPFTWG